MVILIENIITAILFGIFEGVALLHRISLVINLGKLENLLIMSLSLQIIKFLRIVCWLQVSIRIIINFTLFLLGDRSFLLVFFFRGSLFGWLILLHVCEILPKVAHVFRSASFVIILYTINFRLSVLGSIGYVECIFLFVILHREDITRRHLQLIVCDSPSESSLFSLFNLFFAQHPKFI